MGQTLRSILHFTPEALLKELILVSDGNPTEFVYERQLSAMSSKVVILKNSERKGLMMAKTQGAEKASGDVLVFMEPHCIVNRDWLQPLLAHLVKYPRGLVQPMLDIIPQGKFRRYMAATSALWRFEW